MIIRVSSPYNKEVIAMQMKTSVEQSVCAIILLYMLPDKAVLPGEVISQQLGASPTYFQKILRKLVRADLITSVPGVKGGFKLKKKPEEIRIYDIYLAIEGRQSFYSSSGTLNQMLSINIEENYCMINDLMGEAEEAWKSVLQRETVASLSKKVDVNQFRLNIEELQALVNEKMVV